MSVNMSLEDIIKANRKSKSGRDIGGFRSTDIKKGGSSSGSFTRKGRVGGGGSSGGVWKHDKFQEGKRATSFSSRPVVSRNIVTGNHKVTVNLSGLAATVSSADLEELFIDFNPDIVTVHFNEHGESLGTGSIVLRKKDADSLIDTYKGVSLDGLPLKFAIISDVITGGGSRPITQRLDFRNKAVSERRRSDNGPRRSSGGVQKRAKYDPSRDNSSSFLDRIVDDDERPRRGGNGGRGGGRPARGGRNRGGRGETRAAPTMDELDADLDAYMGKK